jgi:photosystem II stability/assembly factor-like uncharacterized protein
MTRLHLLLLFIVLTLAGSCKRDLLEFDKVMQLTGNTTSRLNNIRFLDDATCIISGGSTFYQSTMLRSADGGYTWRTDTNTAGPKEMYGMSVAPGGTVYLCGIDGIVLSSQDKGNTWDFHRIDNWLVNRAGTFPVPDTGIFVSTVLQRQCTITRVTADYSIIDEQTFLFGLNNLYMTTTTTGYALGYGVIMKTTNRGNTWDYLNIKGDNFTAMAFLGEEIWACGAAGGIYHTTDAGTHWERLRNGNDISLPRYMLRCILFTDNQHGWAAGDKGKVIYTNNGGHDWYEYKNFTTSSIRGIASCPNGDLLLCGDNGGIYRIKP